MSSQKFSGQELVCTVTGSARPPVSLSWRLKFHGLQRCYLEVAYLFAEVLNLLCRAGYPNSSLTASKTSVFLVRTQLDWKLQALIEARGGGALTYMPSTGMCRSKDPPFLPDPCLRPPFFRGVTRSLSSPSHFRPDLCLRPLLFSLSRDNTPTNWSCWQEKVRVINK